MKIQTFKASSAKEAIGIVHRTLGPEAVVVNIRKLPKPGWQGLFQSSQVEVSAVLPAASADENISDGGAAASERQELQPSITNASIQSSNPSQAGGRLDIVDDTPIEIPKAVASPDDEFPAVEPVHETIGGSFDQALGQVSINEKQSDREGVLSIERVLEGIGVLPLQVERLLRLAKQRFPNLDSCTISDQIQYIRHCLTDHWNSLAKVAEDNSKTRKVLVGAPGVGKTTVLCKWLTQTVLAKRQPAKVWRLDGHLANTAEMLTVHAEMLDVESSRVWYPEPVTDETIQFFDLPGVMSGDPSGLRALQDLANEVHPAEFILVLNSAYELDHLIRAVREFSDLPINGLIVTHLDEGSRWSKLWNLTLETGLPILYSSGGQDIPGDFFKMTSEMLFQSVIQQLEPDRYPQIAKSVVN